MNSARLGPFRLAIAKPIVLLALPLMLQGFLLTLMGFVDALMIGQLGETAISGLGNSTQLISFCFLLFAALSMGGGVLISQHSGAHEEHALLDVARSMISAGFVAGLGLGVIVYSYSNELIAILTTDIFKPADQWSEVPLKASQYLGVVAFAIPFMLLNQMISVLFNSTGNTKTPVKISIVFNVINFIGNYLFIFGVSIPGMSAPIIPALGLVGAATATLVAVIGQCFTMLVLLHKNFNIGNIFKLNGDDLKRILVLGYPATVDGFYWQSARVFYTVLMNAIGAIAFTGYTIVRTFKGLFMLPVGGLQQATSIHIGKLLGAQKYRLARAAAYHAIVSSVAIMIIPVTLLLLFAHNLLNLYQIQAKTYDLAYQCIWILAFSLFFTAVNSVIPGLLRAGGEAKVVMHITLASFLLVGAPLTFILGITLELGLVGAFIGISLEEIAKAFWFTHQLRKEKWIRKLV